MPIQSQSDAVKLLGLDLAEIQDSPNELLACYREVRGQSEHLCDPLEPEDYVVQSMPDVSPAKWHLAHTSWFFDTFILRTQTSDYRPYHSKFEYLFNSYYNAVGKQYPRPQRGLLSRPTVKDVFRYREWVDEQIEQLIEEAEAKQRRELAPMLLLGMHHEQQHQELMLTDIKHVFSWNPLRPIYRDRVCDGPLAEETPLQWLDFAEGVRETGYDGDGFAFDNESPRHQSYLQGFLLASRLVTNGEYLAFMEDGGYHKPELWLSDGWNTRREEGWSAPMYWEKRGSDWWQMTLAGMQRVVENDPVCHVSYYEADAYANWAGGRLPFEAEWETASSEASLAGNFLEDGLFHPVATDGREQMNQMFGDVWEWTRSPYVPYPGYQPVEGALGEYNGKFMCNQMVLRGGSCVTPQSHIRATYRNFFPPHSRWQFMGIRLARDV